MPRQVVEVVWEDSSATHGWHDADEVVEEPTVHTIRTVGYLMAETEQALVLMMSDNFTPDGKDARNASRFGCTWTIPKAALRSRILLVPDA